MSIYYQDESTAVYHGDCLAVLASMPDNSVDSIVTDPPYGLGFMGRKWDALPPSLEWAEACYRILKPGGHLLAFGGTRTWHRLAVAVEDAGFEIRDSIAWLYGSGFPKSLDVSKAIDKAAGAEREVIGSKITGNAKQPSSRTGEFADGKHGGQQVVEVTAPATPEAAQWDGWGTALKPAFEPIVLARKPLAEKTVARNVLAYGTGGLNIDACRVESDGSHKRSFQPTNNGRNVYGAQSGFEPTNAAGRWPANVMLDEHAAAWVDEQSGNVKGVVGMKKVSGGHNFNVGEHTPQTFSKASECIKDSGGASRFFYCAKAPKSERPNVDGIQHPTVKPLKLMRWLLRLVTPPGGTTLDPFAGSGTTIEAAILEGFHPVGIERESDYLPLVTERITRAKTSVQEVLDLGSLA